MSCIKTPCCHLKILTQIQFGGFEMAAENFKTSQNRIITKLWGRGGTLWGPYRGGGETL